jgi:hypothetical protein
MILFTMVFIRLIFISVLIYKSFISTHLFNKKQFQISLICSKRMKKGDIHELVRLY